MGTSEFAVPCLKALVGSRHPVLATVTAPDRPAGRTLKVTEPPVKRAAASLSLPILQPTDLRDPFFLRAVKGYNPDAAAVVAFRILPTELFTLPRRGCINLHASLLPELRGAAPIQWALMRGLTRTGVTTFLIERQVDTGSILLQESLDVAPDDDAGSLGRRLATVGARLLVESLDRLEAGTLDDRRQQGEVTHAPKITRELCRLDWSKSAVELHNQVRGLSPDPAAFTTLDGHLVKIYRTSLLDGTGGTPGEFVGMREGVLVVATGSGLLGLRELQLEGRRRMTAADFVRGRSLRPGTRFE